jgi:PAS domain S-box-containing protein
VKDQSKTKRTQIKKKVSLDEAGEYAESIINTVREPLIILDQDLRVVTASRSFYDFFKVNPDETEGQLIYNLGNDQWDIPKLRELLETILPQKTTFDNFEVEHEFAGIGSRTMLLNARQIIRALGKERIILLAIEDITERKQLERLLIDSEEQYRRLFETASDGIVLLEKSEGKITQANPATEKLLGYTEKQSIGKKLQEIGVVLDTSDFQTTMHNLNKSGILNYKNVKVKTSSGQHIETEIYLVDRAKLVQCNIRDITEHKRAEEELNKTEELYRLVVDNIADVITVMDMNLRFTYVSPSIQRLRGYTAEEAVAQTIEQVMTPESLQIVAQVFEEELKLEASGTADPGRSRILELEEYRKDGSIVHMENQLSFLRDEAQKPVGIISLTRDIAERMMAEKKLKQTNIFLDSIIENIPNMIFLKDARDLRFIQFNRAGEDLLGYSREELLGKSDYDFFPKEQADHFTKKDRDVLNGKEVVDIPEESLQTRTKGERTIHTKKVPLLDEKGEPEFLLGISEDITERKRAEEQVRESRELYKLLADNTVDCIWMLNTDLVFTYINPAIEAMSGYTPEEWIGSKLSDHCTPERFEQMAALVLQTIEKLPDTAPITFETEMLSKDGRSIPFEIRSAVITDDDGNFVALQGVTRDITERKKAESESEKLQEQLHQAQKMESVGRLAGGVAHDFNNMLGVILGHTELAMDKLDPSQPLYTHLLEVRKAAERSADLTRQLLAFARKQTIAPKVLDLNDTVGGMLKMLRRLIGEDIHLAWMPGANLFPVKVDPSQIDQILANLCVNARDAIEGVGKITIETQDITFDEAFCASHMDFTPGEYVLLAVSDNGCGMDKETQSKLFEPFFTTKEVGKGTGLGLATVYGIVKQNSGFINVYSEPGQGTTFKIYLPQHETGTPVQTDTATAKPVACGNETILLVEDEPTLLRLATIMLERLGYVVIVAKTPGEAIHLAHEHSGPIHLLMTDVVMPGMNGRDLAKNLLSIYPGIKSLFMSGYTANVIVHNGVLDEGVHFIQKPFSLKDLGAKLRDVLEY